MPETLTAIQTAFATFREGFTAAEAALAQPQLHEDLTQAVTTISALQGRLIVTGLGKSGHIASKLAATFSSTGTPAYFVHPAEASHGDLGMIQSGDVVLMLSWSGETRELSDLAAYSRRFKIPLVLITGNGASTLARAADIALVLPKVREACPHNLAPTTSTLLQLAMGDAIAVTLLQQKGFSESSFHNFHPGGKLGAALTAVGQIMHPADALPLVAPDAPVIEVIAALSARNFGIVGVVGPEGSLVGVVTDGDIRRYLERSSEGSMKSAMRQTFAKDIMTGKPACLEPERLAGRALNMMQERRISAAFVLQDGRPIGLVTVLQLLNSGVA
jgi:arabinose-5-phosphate isomerase